MKLLSYFLPQFYATPENDKYWGKGFTEWVNVRNAQPLFEGHAHPLLPVNNNYYNLSKVEVLLEHSEQSIDYGIDAFGYWHYWFGNGKTALEKVPKNHLGNKEIRQNFFFAWSNANWTKSWVGDKDTVVFEQIYTRRSAIDHFDYLSDFFVDDRYLKYNGRPVFQVINLHHEGVKNHIYMLEERAKELFGQGLHWIFRANKNISLYPGLEYSIVGYPPDDVAYLDFNFGIRRGLQEKKLLEGPVKISQKEYLACFNYLLMQSQAKFNNRYKPCIISGWDNTPRYGNKGFLIEGSIEELVKEQFSVIRNIHKEGLPDFVFVKAWNEWAEGNILESHYRRGKLIDLKEIMIEFKK